MKYKRVLLKLSGEVLSGEKGHGIDFERTLELANEIKDCLSLGCEISIVVGGGNFWRGKSNDQMDRATSDYIGMMGTVMNALALGDAFKQLGADVRVQTGVEMRQIAEFYIKDKADIDDFLAFDDAFSVAMMTLVADYRSLAAADVTGHLGLHHAEDALLGADLHAGAVTVRTGLAARAAFCTCSVAMLTGNVLAYLEFLGDAVGNLLQRQTNLQT